MSKIYLEMFVTDEWLMRYPQGRKADTMLVYEPVFLKYGYTSDDYRASVHHYLEDPDRFARILRATSADIDVILKDLNERKEAQDAVKNALERARAFRPERVFNMTSMYNKDVFSIMDSIPVHVDSTGGEWMFDPQLGLDTVFRGPEIVVRNVCDSLLQADTLTQTDTFVRADAPSHIDSLLVKSRRYAKEGKSKLGPIDKKLLDAPVR